MQGERKRELYDHYKPTGCKLKVYDYPLTQTVENGRRSIREFDIEELLFRQPMEFTHERTHAYYRNKTVLISGGGGSIGSELCRQIAKMQPKRLIILDVYENGAYDIQQELRIAYGAVLDVCVEIVSVCDADALDCVFERYRPDIVLHAAAHKHVPLMEHNCCEAVKNNVFGTLNIVSSSERFGVKKFTMISTDKAVNPTNVMGATKRMCEMIVLSRAGSKTNFSATRFGNVLGSNGSVIPLFKRQIAAGGPVTLTDRRIIRYFMTIPEASQLVLESGAMAKDGELYVLDMGRPVRILELAESMIRLSGFEPYRDINIVETGLRPGEKLYEELLIKTEELTKTENSMIFIERDKPLSRQEIDKKLEILRKAVQTQNDEKVRLAMKRVVDTYQAPEVVNQAAVEAEEMKLADREEDCAG
ncbi:MAG: polysaccharide biosynthesis protein [Clostridia bacterium]|nr:polysaccharide biosynthesis protein [Clostridia bacterium]